MKHFTSFTDFVNESKRQFQVTPDPIAYSEFLKWAGDNKDKLKKDLSGIIDATKFFIALADTWRWTWADKNAKEWSYLHSTDIAKKDFGRALASMLKGDDLIISKSGNKLTTLK